MAPDELAHARPAHLDPADVAGDDRKAATNPAEDLPLLQRFAIDPGDTLVDLGAGSGSFALAAAPRGRRVVAVSDVSRSRRGDVASPVRPFTAKARSRDDEDHVSW